MIGRALSLALAALLTAAALWYLIEPGTLPQLRFALAHADWWMLGLAMALSAAVQWLRAWRFSIMTSGDPAFPDAGLVRIAFQLNFFNFVLPFRLGELSYPVLMRRAYGQPLLDAAGVLLLARLFDLCTVGAILLGTAAWLGLAGTGTAVLLLALAAAALALAPTILVLAANAAGPFVSRLPLVGSFAGPLAAAFASLRTRPARLAAIGLSFAVWLTFGVLAILTANAVVDGISPAVALLGASAGNAAFALPINGIAGLGPAQAAWVAALSQAGVPWPDALVSALALYAVVLASALLFGGIAMIGRRQPRLA
jgi:hypothetical protein